MPAVAPSGRFAGVGRRRPRRWQVLAALALVTAVALGSLIVTGDGDESPATLTSPTPAPGTTSSATEEAAASAAPAADAVEPTTTTDAGSDTTQSAPAAPTDLDALEATPADLLPVAPDDTPSGGAVAEIAPPAAVSPPATPEAAPTDAPADASADIPVLQPGAAVAAALDAYVPLSPLLTLSDQAALALQSWPEFIMTFVREGESLKAVAERFNTTVTALAAVNALANPDAPAEGEALLVPVGFRIR